MKKSIVLVTVLALVLSMSFAVMADTLSVGAEPPAIITQKDTEGNDVAGAIVNAEGEVVNYVDLGEIAVYGVNSEGITAEQKTKLDDAIKSAQSAASLEDLAANVDDVAEAGAEYAITDVFVLDKGSLEVSENAALKVVIDLGVDATGKSVIVMTQSSGEWVCVHAANIVVEGNKAIVTFTELCPVLVAVETDEATVGVPVTGDAVHLAYFGAIAILLSVAFVCFYSARKERS